MFIEQKEGQLAEKERGLVKYYRGGGSTNVADQIHRNHENIREKLKRTLRQEQAPHVDYLLYLPNYRVVEVNAAGIARDRIVDQSDMGNLCRRIQKILGPGDGSKPEYTHRVLRFFNHEFRVVPAVSTYLAKQEKLYTRMREGLADVVESIDFSPFRLRVEGAAGCGKSQLTLRFFEHALQAGKRPLLLCFNHELGRSLSDATGHHPAVGTFHDFCIQAATRAGEDIDFSQASDAGFWSDVLDRVIGLEVAEADKYDFLIVDEGQDFEQGWFERLGLFLQESADILWLEDQQQNLVGKPQVRLDGFVTYRERSNFRTPQRIGRFIKDVLDVDFRMRNPLPGHGVGVYTFEDEDHQVQRLTKRINALLEMGFAPDEIVVVSCKGLGSSGLLRLDQAGPHTLKHFAGTYDADRHQEFTPGDIFVETIYRFKGRQAPAVIVADIHPGMKQDGQAQRRLYCAMTRASVRLELLVDRASPWAKPLLDAREN
jgi:hypothetical protein